MISKKILLIEDDDDDQEIFQEAVNQIGEGIDYMLYSNAIKAMKALKDKTIEPDLIFLDLNMPLMNGQQFLVEIKSQPELEHIPVYVLSTSSHASSKTVTKSLGATDFFSKPSSVDELVTMIKSVLA